MQVPPPPPLENFFFPGFESRARKRTTRARAATLALFAAVKFELRVSVGVW